MLSQQFKAARRVSAPIVAIKTADQWAVVQGLSADLRTKDNAPPLLTWDLARGMVALNEPGRVAFANIGIDPLATANPAEALMAALKLPERAILFCYNFHRVVSNEVVSQAVWNTREQFKRDGRTLVLLGPDMPFPAELANDVLVLDDALPTETDLTAIVEEQLDAADLRAVVSEDDVTRAVTAVAGLAAFPAEQAVAMSLTRQGLDVDALWERKRQAIEQAPGLSVYRGAETFDDIGGVENAKTFGRSILSGTKPPRAIVFIDEIEKALSGAGGDTSGVSQEMLGTLLTWMQDKQVTGMLLVGPPGAAKSAYAKSLGTTGRVPTIQFDLSGMKGSLVGESGRNLRQALKVVDAVAQDHALVVATCNSISTLPPELRRRFTFGTFFFDLPSVEERAAIWALYAKKYGRTPTPATLPEDEGWTGAEIRMCCDLATRLDISLRDAAAYIVPVARSAAESIAKLREGAVGRFISASYAGPYRPATQPVADAKPRGRRFQEA